MIQKTLLRIMEETTGAPDLETFRDRLFRLLEEAVDLPLAALNFASGVGPVRVAQSRDLTELQLRSKMPQVIEEQAALLTLPFETHVGVVSEVVPISALDQLATYHHVWKPHQVRDGVHASIKGADGMRAQVVLLVSDRRHLRSYRGLMLGLAPYLVRALDHLAYLERIQVRLDSLEELVRQTAPLLLIGRLGGVEWVSESAQDLFRRLTGSPAIPASLRAWIDERRARHPLAVPSAADPIAIGERFVMLRAKPLRTALGGYDLVTIDLPRDRSAQAFAARCTQLGLTEREQDVAALLLDGRMNSDIAARLGIAPNTVKNHVANIYRRSGARNRAEFVAAMLERDST